MLGLGSDAETRGEGCPSVPPAVTAVVREMVRRKFFAILLLALALVVVLQAALLLVLSGRPVARLFVPESTLLEGRLFAEESR